MVTIHEAQNLILQHIRSFGEEKIALEDALQRVLAADISADRDYPPFNRSTMDGYAVRTDSLQAGAPLKVIYDLHAGDIFKSSIQKDECVRIMTGAPVPDCTDAVIKAEEASPAGGKVVFSSGIVERGQNIAFRGEDIKENDILLPKGSMIAAAQQALLAVAGYCQATVTKLPEVIVYSTGNEVQALRKPVLPHQIRDSNSYALQGLLKLYAIHAAVNEPVPDNPLQLKAAFLEGLHYDIMIISGGVSKGAADHVPRVLRELGVKELFHGVRIKPGKPLWAGVSTDKKIVLALPGNPVSVQTAFKVFIEPFIRSCFGMQPLRPCYFPLSVSRQPRSSFDEFFPAMLQGGSDKRTRIHPVACNGSGDIAATAHSDGLALHPAGAGELEQQSPVAFYPWHHTPCS